MVDYAKTTCLVTYSANSDYTSPSIAAAITKAYATATERLDVTRDTSTGGKTVVISSVGSPSAVLVFNLDSSIAITASYASTLGTDAQVIPAGDWIKLTDVSSSTAITLTSASGTPLCRVIVFGAS